MFGFLLQALNYVREMATMGSTILNKNNQGPIPSPERKFECNLLLQKNIEMDLLGLETKSSMIFTYFSSCYLSPLIA